jgi:hypothetical protein
MTDWPANVGLLMADAAVAITDQKRRKKEFPTALTLPSFLPSFVSLSQQITRKGKHTRELQQVEQQTTTRETLIPFLARTSRNRIEADICTERVSRAPYPSREFDQ